MQNWLPDDRRLCGLLLVVLIVAVLVRLHQYLARGALWTDEAGLAMNVVGRDIDQIARPFLYEQVAPYLYLVATKFVTLLAGEGELSLRLLSVLASLATLVLVYQLAVKLFDFRTATIVACLIAFSSPLILYASEFKPYGGDAAFSALLLLLAVRYLLDESRTTRKLVVLGAAGGVVSWLSLPSVFILSGIGAALIWDLIGRRATLQQWLIISAMGAGWLGSFAVHYQLFLAHTIRGSGLEEYWVNYDVFAPFPPHSLADVRWYAGKFVYAFQDPGGLGMRYLAGVLWLGGMLILARRRPALAIMLAVPCVTLIGASAVHLYVISPRLMFFLVPIMLIPVAGILSEMIGRGVFLRVASIAIVAAILCEPINATYQALIAPRDTENIGTAVAYLKEHYQSRDRVFVEQQVEWTYLYYSHRSGVDVAPVFGHAGPDDKISHAPPAAEVLETLRGEPRVWLIVPSLRTGNIVAENAIATILGARNFVRHAVEAQGKQLSFHDANSAQIWLYDLRSGHYQSGQGQLRRPKKSGFGPIFGETTLFTAKSLAENLDL